MTEGCCPHNRVGPDPDTDLRRHEIAKAKGHLRSKQPKLRPRQEAHLVSLFEGGEYSTSELADLFGVGRSTVYRAIERQRIAAKAGLAEATSRR